MTQHVVITGASSGIGAALARAFAARGARVGVIARREELLQALVAEIRATGGTAEFAVADVTDRAATANAVRTLVEAHGSVDLMLANAGTSQLSASTRARADVFTRLMRINYDGVVHAFDAVLPDMLERGSGHLAAVSSLAARTHVPSQGAYCASKAAVSSLMRTLSAELRPRGIAVTCIHPGFVDTPLAQSDRGPKPFMIPASRAAEIILRGLEKRRRSIDFPLPMVAATSLARFLPSPLFEWAVSRLMPVPDPKPQTGAEGAV